MPVESWMEIAGLLCGLCLHKPATRWKGSIPACDDCYGGRRVPIKDNQPPRIPKNQVAARHHR